MGIDLRRVLSGNTSFSSVYFKLKSNQAFMMLLIAIGLFLIGGIINVRFLSLTNIGSILGLAALLGFAAAGQTLVVAVGGGIDISAGSMMSLGAIIAVQVMNIRNLLILPSLVYILITGAIIGLINAGGIIRAKVPPLVMTLAMASVITSIQLLYSGGTPEGKPAPIITFIGTARLLPMLPYLVIVAIITVILMQFLLNRTVFGRHFFATGNNVNAAFLSGVRVHRIKTLVYMFSGMLAGTAGFWFAAYNTFINVNIANHFVLPSVAAVIIGGTPFSGGKGAYTGSIVGAIVLTLVESILIMLKMEEAGRKIFYGIILIGLLAAYNREPPIRQ